MAVAQRLRQVLQGSGVGAGKEAFQRRRRGQADVQRKLLRGCNPRKRGAQAQAQGEGAKRGMAVVGKGRKGGVWIRGGAGWCAARNP